MSMRLGIDVGGTNTDAVLMDAQDRVVAAAKAATTPDPLDGIGEAIDRVLAQAPGSASAVAHAMLGTTHCTNAILQRQGLGRVGTLRLAGPATDAVPPLAEWPEDLRAAVDGGTAIVRGGIDISGRPYAEIDEDEIAAVAESWRDAVTAVAVSGVFSPIDPSQEERAASIVERVLGLPVTMAHQVGTLGLLERENAAVLNAALNTTVTAMIDGFGRVLAERGIDAVPFFGQNDGTLMNVNFARAFPVLTIGCGPTNSLRGAAHLTGITDGLVVDIGGTSTDIGALVGGMVRQSAHAVDIGGIRTNFRMPDTLSIGLGGGSRVRLSDDGASVGPDSVGYALRQEALCFGGGTLTATDIAAARDPELIAEGRPVSLEPAVREAAEQEIARLLADAVDRMKTSAQDVPVVLVGGGSAIVGGTIAGTTDTARPDHFAVANAIGAALADVAAEAELIYRPGATPRAEALEEVSRLASERATAAGADPETIAIASVHEVPVAYASDGATVLTARAAGRIRLQP